MEGLIGRPRLAEIPGYQVEPFEPDTHENVCNNLKYGFSANYFNYERTLRIIGVSIYMSE